MRTRSHQAGLAQARSAKNKGDGRLTIQGRKLKTKKIIIFGGWECNRINETNY